MIKYIIFMIVLIAADQAIKLAVISQIGMGGQMAVVENFFYLSCISNDGTAFGMWAQFGGAVIALTAFFMGALCMFIVLHAQNRSLSPVMLAVLSMILGGGVGNLIDRVRLGYVIDYLDFRVWPYIFNFADIWVVVGCFALMFMLLFTGKKSKKA